MWCPPTPPQQDTDVYIDQTISFLYNDSVMSESQLPPIYKKDVKRRLEGSFGLDYRRPLKIPRKEDTSIAPRSLFHSPALLKMKRDLKLQKYRGLIRPSISIPGKPNSSKPASEQSVYHNWTIHEDMALLKVIQTFQGLPLNLIVMSPGQTPNWDFVADYVNTVSITYRSPKQCRQRYESFLMHREEGKYNLLDSAMRKKKKAGQLQKLPLPTKSRPSLRTSQLYTQDNNTSFSQIMSERFDTLKSITNKRLPTTRTVVNNPLMNKTKSAPLLSDCGIDLEHPVLPVEVAARRAERIAKEKKTVTPEQMAKLQIMKGIMANQQQQAQVQTTSASSSISGQIVQTTSGVPIVALSTSQVIVSQSPVVVTTASVITTTAGTPPSTLRPQRIIASPLQTSTVVSVSGLSPAQLQAATQRLIVSAGTAGQTKTVVGSPAGVQGKQFSQAQLQMIRQASLKNQLRLHANNIAQGAKTSTVTIGGQQAVVQFTQAQPRTQFVRPGTVTVGGKTGVTRTVTESEVAQLLKKQHQLQQQKLASGSIQASNASVTGSTIHGITTQVFAQAIQQAGTSGTPVATLVKTVPSSTGVSQTVTIPVSGVTLATPGAKAIAPLKTTPQQLRQMQIQQQLLNQKKIAGGQKLSIAQVGGKNNVQTQLIVGSKPMPTAMTVQQFQQVIRAPLNVSQGPVVLAKGTSRVIPVNTGQGTKQTIQVVAASSQALGSALRPQGTTTIAGIKLQGTTNTTQQALLSQVSAALSHNVGVRQNSPVRIQTASGQPIVAVTVQSPSQSAQSQSPNPDQEISELRKYITKAFSATPLNALKYYQKIKSHSALIPTGISDLDDLLHGGLFTGTIYEVCCSPGFEKTFFISTLLQNVVADNIIFFLDPKQEFSGKYMKMLLNKFKEKENCLKLLSNILVKHIATKHDLIRAIFDIKQNLENGVSARIVIIHYLSTLFLDTNNNTENNNVINHLANVLRYIAHQHHVVIIITNLVTTWIDGDFRCVKGITEKIACGKYWCSIPNVRLKLNREEDNILKISLVKYNNNVIYSLDRYGIMFKTTGVIPTRFLVLIAHFTICVNLLWSSNEILKSCLMVNLSEPEIRNHHTKVVVGLGVAIGLIIFEFFVFICGFTMFNNTSGLISIFTHTMASLTLCLLFVEKWQCGWFWWIFTFGSILPILYDVPDISVEYPGWTKLLFLAGLITVLGSSTPVGYNIGVINNPGYIIKQFCNESTYARSGLLLDNNQLEILWSSIVSIFLIGGTVGSLSGSYLADRIGRKGGLAISSVFGVIAGILFWTAKSANSIEMLFIGRIFGGLSAGLITTIMPMYLMECAPPRLKGSTGALCPLGVTSGILLGQILSMYKVLGNENDWPHCLAISAILQASCALVIPVLPESPKYLFVIKKQPQLALKELKRIRNVNEESLTDEMEVLRLESQENIRQGDTWNIIKVLRNKSLLLPLLLVCTLQAGQQLSGVNAVFYYSSSIFLSTGLSTSSSELATIGAGCCNIFMAIVSIQTMSYFRRRTILQISLLSSTCFLILLGISISYMGTYQWMSYLCIVGVLGYVLCYGLGLGPIPYFIGSELFEVGPRSSAMALGSMANWAGNFIVGLTFPMMATYIGAASFFIFAVVAIAIFIFIRVYLPETKGKDTCEISHLVENGFRSRPLMTQTVVPNTNYELRNLNEKISP